jgi:hypothetical protein
VCITWSPRRAIGPHGHDPHSYVSDAIFLCDFQFQNTAHALLYHIFIVLLPVCKGGKGPPGRQCHAWTLFLGPLAGLDGNAEQWHQQQEEEEEEEVEEEEEEEEDEEEEEMEEAAAPATALVAVAAPAAPARAAPAPAAAAPAQ